MADQINQGAQQGALSNHRQSLQAELTAMQPQSTQLQQPSGEQLRVADETMAVAAELEASGGATPGDIEALRLAAADLRSPRPMPTDMSVGAQKQNKLAETSQRKKLELGGLTSQEQDILDGGLEQYLYGVSNADAANKAREYYALERKAKAVQAQTVPSNPDALFQDLDSPLEFAGNTGLSIVNTVGQIAGGLVSAIPTLAASGALANISEDELGRYQHVANKIENKVALTPEEEKFANSDTFDKVDFALGSLDAAETVQEVFGGLGKYVNRELTDAVVADAKGAFDDLTAGNIDTGEFVSRSVDALTDNMGGLLQGSIESIPYMLAAVYNLPLTIASAAANNQVAAIQEFTESKGQLPTQDDVLEMSALAVGQAAMDMVGDRLLGRSVMQAGRGVRMAGVAAVQGAAGEFVAEGGAEVLGQLAGQADVTGDVDWGQAYGAGLMGAGSSGVTTGGMSLGSLQLKQH